MAPLDIFQIPGHYALKLILVFFQVPARTLDPSLAGVFAFMLSLIIWSWLLSVCIAIVKRQLGFGPRGR